MNDEQFNELLSYLMVNAMHSAVLVAQGQEQRPLTREEIDQCHMGTSRTALAYQKGLRDGADSLDGWKPPSEL